MLREDAAKFRDEMSWAQFGTIASFVKTCALSFADAVADADTPMHGPILFVNFLAAVPGEDLQEEMMIEVKARLNANSITVASHFANLDVNSLKLLADGAPAGAF